MNYLRKASGRVARVRRFSPGVRQFSNALFTEEERMVQESARAWARKELAPLVREMDEKESMDEGIIQSLFEQGYLGMEIDPELGGSGLSFTAACLAVEEISRVDPSVAIVVDIQNTLINNSLRFWGSTEIQEKWLPRLATDTVGSFCLSEAESGSDAFAMKTTATKTGDDYLLNGSKLWISNAQVAGAMLVFANADPTKGYTGITAFMVDAKSDGIEIGPPEKKLGLKASSTCPVHFSNVVVPQEDVLGEVGMGYQYCIKILNEGRIGIACQQLGVAKACLEDIAIPYVKERKQFGKSIADFQGIRFQIADLATQIHAADVMTYNACRMKEEGLAFTKEASMAKLFASRVSEKSASLTIEMLGGVGFTRETMAEKFWRDSKVGSIYEGTSNMQMETIAKILLADKSLG